MTSAPSPNADGIGKKCPFCQAPGVLVVAEPKRRFVECTKCGAGSEPAETDALAIKNWTRRVRAFETRPSAWFARRPDAEAA
ncbi:MAG: hypothetical protein FD144_4794 [Rhodospirillaceae bacterium]|nr:MAG: hypothetical protein FD144_4794 [Rhodospirillaceae bacterium]